tara:strand:+ start:79 stop:900 length:822 start_codon:yes stop_codon:yes gene_type:complete
VLNLGPFTNVLNTPFNRAGRYRDNYLEQIFGRPKETRYVPSKEAQRLLDEFTENIGREMQIKPFSDEDVERSKIALRNERGASGIYKPDEINTVYLRDKVPLTTLVHELAHASDPQLSLDNVMEIGNHMSQGPVPDNWGPTPNAVSYFDKENRADAFRHYSREPLHTYEAEVLAEKAADDYVKEKGKGHFNYRPIDEYPRMYIDNFLNEVFTSKGLLDYGNSGESKYNPSVRRYQYDQEQLDREIDQDPRMQEEIQRFNNRVQSINDKYIGGY